MKPEEVPKAPDTGPLRQRRVEGYFRKPAIRPSYESVLRSELGCTLQTCAIVIGVGVLLMLFTCVWKIAFVLGAAVVGVMCWLLVEVNKKRKRLLFDSERTEQERVSDRYIDELLYHDIAQLQAGRALEYLNIHDTELVGERSVVVYAPGFDAQRLQCRQGGDRTLRFSHYNVTIIMFAEHQLLSYACLLDLATGVTLGERSEEFFYRDVVAVTTRSRSLEVNIEGHGTLQLKSAETFALTTSGGVSIELTLSDPQLLKSLGGDRVKASDVDKAVRCVRMMLREKKVD